MEREQMIEAAQKWSNGHCWPDAQCSACVADFALQHIDAALKSERQRVDAAIGQVACRCQDDDTFDSGGLWALRMLRDALRAELGGTK